MDKSIQTPAPKPNNIRSFDLISIESSEIVLNLLQSELFEELNMPLLSYISDKDLEELPKCFCSESAFCEFFRGLFQYGELDFLFSAISFIVGDYLLVGLAIEIMKNPNIW